MSLLNILPPRSFADQTVPARTDGTSLRSCLGPGDYELYVNWLADYLHTASLPLTPAQETWLQQTQRAPDKVIFECSDTFGYALYELEEVEQAFEKGESWAHHRKRARAFWDAIPEQERSSYAESTFEEWFALDETVFDRLRREWQEEHALPQPVDHADVPFRPLLAWALRQIPERDERVRQIDWFFRNFGDNASK